MPKVAVRLATDADLAPLTAIMLAMERHYEPDGIPDPAPARRRIAQALFGPAPLALAFLAVDGEAPVGVAVVSWLFPTKSFRPGLFLKDMFVLEARRGQGIGRKLLAAVVRHARDNGHPRVDWTTDRGNAAAAGLYRGLGAVLEDKLFFRVREGAYSAFLRQAEAAD